MFKLPAAASFTLCSLFSLLILVASKRCWALCLITVLNSVHSQILIELDFKSFNFSSKEM